jgi:hypothetical protein
MVAEHRRGGVAQRHDLAQAGKRGRAAVDQIAGQPQPVAPGVEVEGLEQLDELGVAALEVADGIGGHPGSLFSVS